MGFDSRIPDKEHCVLPYQLERWARERADQTAVIFCGGESWTWAQTLEFTQRTANSFVQLGVTKGDHVLSWQPNNKEALLTWFGLNYLGAVYVPVNTAYKGLLLEHIVQLSDAKLMVCHADLAPRLAAIDCASLEDVVVTCGEVTGLDKFKVHPASTISHPQPLLEMPQPVEPCDTQYIIFTSGTTGPSKAVLSSYLQGYSMGPEAHPYVDGSDRSFINMPLFHAGGTIYVIMTLANGGSCFIDTHFKTDQFWQTVRDYQITSTCLVTAMVLFLLKLPASDEDKNHPLKKALCVPWNVFLNQLIT